jgi:hypothetical protein
MKWRKNSKTFRNEMQQMEAGIRKDMQIMEASLRQEMQLMETSLRKDIQHLEITTNHNLMLLEQRMVIKLGSLMVLAIGVMATLVKLL